jgi:hypothetical protein
MGRHAFALIRGQALSGLRNAVTFAHLETKWASVNSLVSDDDLAGKGYRVYLVHPQPCRLAH